jgi:hypothetical protein
MALYPNLFKSRYPVLQGRDWINTIEPDDKQAFIQIGLQATDYGKLGGAALVKTKGKKYMKRIARRGAIMANIRKWWNRAVMEETARLAEEGARADI